MIAKLGVWFMIQIQTHLNTNNQVIQVIPLVNLII